MTESASPPFVSVSADADRRVRLCLDHILEAARSRSTPRLRGAVLGGSLARGEGVVLLEADGPRLLSDIDLYLVVDDGEPSSRATLLDSIHASLAGDRFLTAPLDIGIVAPDYFERFEESLPSRQLAHGHRILFEGEGAWSRPAQGVVPGHDDRTAVHPEDALRLLQNRFCEHLLVGWRGLLELADPFAVYHRWKIWMDAPLAWLSAWGRYHPDRGIQLERMEEVKPQLPEAAASWLQNGIERLHAMRSSGHRSALTREDLEQLSGLTSVRGQPRHLQHPRRYALAARDDLIEWAWPFYRSTLDRVLHDANSTAEASLARAVDAGAPSAYDADRGQEWLRRQPLPARLRRARSCAKESPRRITPWWRHGRGGRGTDRIYAAAALRFAGREEWRASMEALVVNTHGLTAIPRDDERIDTWIGEFWSDWVMGGRRR